MRTSHDELLLAEARADGATARWGRVRHHLFGQLGGVVLAFHGLIWATK